MLPAHAATVASWVTTRDEMFWLSPRSAPPITAETIRLNWARPGHEQLSLVDEAGAQLAYGELNILDQQRAEYWLGHLIVDPRRRGQGLGKRLTLALLRRAEHIYAARRVCLVVFPENVAAVACYRAAGFRDEAYEPHEFPAYDERALMLRMDVRFGE
ncbi:MAG: GNAT family N-acetyltransferase [Phycisphaerae bacterium]